MLTSINPLGERIRGNRWATTVAWLTIGSIVGGALLGALVGGFGVMFAAALSESSRLIVLAVVLIAAAVWDLLDRRFPGRRQVDENWLTTYRAWVYGFGFGAQLGFGLATVVHTALVPVMLVAAALADDVAIAVLIGIAFGATRGLTLLLSVSVRNPDDLRRLHRRIDEYDVTVRRAGAWSALGLGVLAVAAIGV